MRFKILIFSLVVLVSGVPTPSRADHFNCDKLTGTYECSGNQAIASMIEMSGKEITYYDDAQLPLAFKIGTKKGQASSEKQHVQYSATCKRDQILIKSTVTNLVGGITSKIETRLELNKDGDLIHRSKITLAHSYSQTSSGCSRIEAQ